MFSDPLLGQIKLFIKCFYADTNTNIGMLSACITMRYMRMECSFTYRHDASLMRSCKDSHDYADCQQTLWDIWYISTHFRFANKTVWKFPPPPFPTSKLKTQTLSVSAEKRLSILQKLSTIPSSATRVKISKVCQTCFELFNTYPIPLRSASINTYLECCASTVT